MQVLRPQQDVIRDVQQTHGMGDLGDGGHAASQEAHLALELLGQVQKLLQSVDRRAEAGHNDALVGPVEDVFQAGPHGAFSLGVAGAVHVGGIRQ